jgi:hypothetical protein
MSGNSEKPLGAGHIATAYHSQRTATAGKCVGCLYVVNAKVNSGSAMRIQNEHNNCVGIARFFMVWSNQI